MALQKQKVNTRTRILDSAIKLFSERGFSGTTTKEIADSASVNEALIFRYFSSKRDLYGAIIEKKIEEQLGIEEPLIRYRETKDDLLIFKSIAHRMFETCGNDPTFIRLLHFSALEGHELSDMFFDTYVEYINNLLGDYIEQRISDGAFKNLDPYIAARAFIGMIINYIIVQELFGGKKKKNVSTDSIVDSFVTVFLSGVRKGE